MPRSVIRLVSTRPSPSQERTVALTVPSDKSVLSASSRCVRRSPVLESAWSTLNSFLVSDIAPPLKPKDFRFYYSMLIESLFSIMSSFFQRMNTLCAFRPRLQSSEADAKRWHKL